MVVKYGGSLGQVRLPQHALRILHTTEPMLHNSIRHILNICVGACCAARQITDSSVHTHTHTNTHKSNQNLRAGGKEQHIKNLGKCCPTFSREKTRDKKPPWGKITLEKTQIKTSSSYKSNNKNQSLFYIVLKSLMTILHLDL